MCMGPCCGNSYRPTLAAFRIPVSCHRTSCSGYCEKKDYKAAQQQLAALDEKKLIGIQKVAYLADCAYVAFYLKDRWLDERSRNDVDYLQQLLFRNKV